MTKQDEKQRLKNRLEEFAIQMAAQSRWEETIEVNQHILTIEENAIAYNRLGKASMEIGLFREAYEAYQNSLRVSPTNAIARKNLTRLDALLARGQEHAPVERKTRYLTDMRTFITEAGKTVITTLVDVPRTAAVEVLATSEQVDLVMQQDTISVVDLDGNILGNVEPRLAQHLKELLKAGNKYIAAIAQCDPGKIQVLIREIYQHPSLQGTNSFPSKLSDTMFSYTPGLRFDYETEEFIEDEVEEIVDETDETDDDFGSSDEDEELGLEEIEKDMPDDEENEE